MEPTEALTLLAYYVRDGASVTALSAAIVLLILGFYRASRGLGLRMWVTGIGFLALVAGSVLSMSPVDRALFLSRLQAVETLIASVVVWMLSVIVQGYYGK